MKSSFSNIFTLLLSTSSLAASSGAATCNKPLTNGVEPGKSTNLTLTSKSGVSPRKYRLHLPKTYDGSTNLPLILSFHGRGKDAKFQEKLSQFSNSSYGFDGISVYPEGVPFKEVSKNTRTSTDQLLTILGWQRTTMGRRPRRPLKHQRRHIHPRTPRRARENLLHRHIPYLCSREIQWWRLHRSSSLRPRRNEAHCSFRACLRSFLP